MTERRHHPTTALFWPILVLLLACGAVYFNALSNGFVYDDKAQIVENQWIRDIKYVPKIFISNVWSFYAKPANYYRPLMHIFYMVNYHLFGLAAWGFHLVNVLLHSGVTVLVFLIVSRLLKAHRLEASSSSYFLSAFIATMLFALHPIHTEAVSWVAGLPELSFTLFFLLSLYHFIIFREGFRGHYVYSLIAFVLATFCKETALTLPVILVIYDYAYKKNVMKKFASLNIYFPYLAVSGLYLAIRYYALGGFAPEKHHTELSTYQSIINIFPLFAQYLGKLLLPINLNAYHVFHPISSLLSPSGLLSLAIAVVFAVFVFIASKKGGPVLVGLSLLIVPLIPAFYIPGLGENAFAERYLYLPSVGFVLLVGLSISGGALSTPKKAMMLTVVFIAVAGLYSAGTVRRNTIWMDGIRLWADTMKKSPDGSVPHLNFGNSLRVQGRIDEAIKEYEISIYIKPSSKAYDGLGSAYLAKGLADEAVKYYQVSLEYDPYNEKTYNNLAIAYEELGLIDNAIKHFRLALELRSDFAEAHNNLGLALRIKGWTDQAMAEYEAAIALNPELADAHYNLGLIYLEKRLIEKAIAQLEVAYKLNPADTDFRNGLAKAYEMRGLSH